MLSKVAEKLSLLQSERMDRVHNPTSLKKKKERGGNGGRIGCQKTNAEEKGWEMHRGVLKGEGCDILYRNTGPE